MVKIDTLSIRSSKRRICENFFSMFFFIIPDQQRDEKWANVIVLKLSVFFDCLVSCGKNNNWILYGLFISVESHNLIAACQRKALLGFFLNETV